MFPGDLVVCLNPWEEGKLLVRRVKQITQIGDSIDAAVAWVKYLVPFLFSRFLRVLVTSITTNRYSFSVGMRNRIMVLFRITSNHSHLIAFTFPMVNIFSNDLRLCS